MPKLGQFHRTPFLNNRGSVNLPLMSDSVNTSCSTRCFSQLACELNISKSNCKVKGCKFSHEKLSLPLSGAVKKDLLLSFNLIKSDEFKKLMTDAVNTLQSV